MPKSIYFRELKDRCLSWFEWFLVFCIITLFFLRLYSLVFIFSCFFLVFHENNFRKSCFNYILFEDDLMRIENDGREVFRMNISDIKDCFISMDSDDEELDRLYIIGDSLSFSARIDKKDVCSIDYDYLIENSEIPSIMKGVLNHEN